VIICLDATPLTMTSGGLPRYVSELGAALVEGFPSDKIVVSSDQPFPAILQKLPGPANWFERRWWLYGAERANSRAGVSVFHGTNFAVPYFSRRPTVMTVHDLSPWLNPAWHGGANRVRQRAPRMIGLATMILTLTQAVKREVVERFRIQPERIAVTPLAAAARFRPVPGPPAKPYFVFVGTLEPRKNIPLLLEAWRELRRTDDVDLVLAGRTRPDFPPVQPEPGLHLLGETPEEDLPRLYSNAVAAIYPSQYEGFGLPVLEAMQCGVPVIISHDPALAEVSGGAAIAVSTAAEMVAGMKSLLRDPALRAQFSAQSLGRARAFSWAATAHLTREVYLEAIARFGR
jgi:glycosyltransferase involved in cell wall biosynthesis